MTRNIPCLVEAAASVAPRPAADPDLSRSSAEAAGRLEETGPNELEVISRPPWWLRFVEQFRDPLIHLLLAAVVVSLVAWVAEGVGAGRLTRW